MSVRAEILAQCLAERFSDPEGAWEWNELADWLTDVFLPAEHRLGRLKDLLGIEGATYVTYDAPLDPSLGPLLDGLGLRVEQRRVSKGHAEQVLVLGMFS
jgi:hypothetical protein